MVHRITLLLTLYLVSCPAQPAYAATDSDFPTTAIEEPHYGEVLFYFYQSDYFPAIVNLLAAQQESRLGEHDAEAELLLGGLYLSYGMHLRAAEIFERLLQNNVNPNVRDRTWFFLAKIWHQRGYFARSQQALEKISVELPEGLEPERQMLYAQLLIEQGKYSEAIARLDNWNGPQDWMGYAKFNLGVALVRDGQVEIAARMLDEVGQLEPASQEQAALRDKANLALGFAYLQDSQPAQAKPRLQRVRLDGPFSNKALLGVGWADAEIQNYRRALVPWMELRKRDLLDSAVQESLLAIPYAMAQLNATNQAAEHYVNAIEAFFEETHRIDRTITSIEQGEMLEALLTDDPLEDTGWYWRLEKLPAGAEARYLYHVLAANEFQEGLKNFRDLRSLLRNLDQWQDNVGVYRNMLDTRELAFETRLPKIEASLAAADLEGMVDHKLELEARLNEIDSGQDALALATPQEYAVWQEIAALEQQPGLRAPLPEAADARHKVRLLKGVMLWDLEKSYKARLWKSRRDLRDIGDALVDAQMSRRAVDDSVKDEPGLFLGFNQRVDGLDPRIEQLKVRVSSTLQRQETHLESLAVKELQAQKHRLDTYTVQARFALASIYDRATEEEQVE